MDVHRCILKKARTLLPAHIYELNLRVLVRVIVLLRKVDVVYKGKIKILCMFIYVYNALLQRI